MRCIPIRPRIFTILLALIAGVVASGVAVAGEFMFMPTVSFAHQNRSLPEPTLEAQGGHLPIHLFGLLLQGSHAISEGSLQYDIGVASGPRILDGELDAVDVVRHPRLNKLALVARFAYRPDATLDDQYGVFVAR